MLIQLEETLFDRPYAHVLIAEAVNDPMPNKPVGFALYYYAYSTWTSRPTLFLEDLFVLKEYRNHGLGKRLFRHLGEIAKKENCPRIEWNVLTWNEFVSKLTQTIHCLLQGDIRCTDARRMAWYASRRKRDRTPRVAIDDRGVTGRHLRLQSPFPKAAPVPRGAHWPHRLVITHGARLRPVVTTFVMAQTVGSIDPSSVPGGNGGYELHQKLRTKTVRLLKKEKYNEAIDVLYDGSVRLLEMNEQGSGCDLAVYLLEAYGLAKTPVNDVSRGRLFC